MPTFHIDLGYRVDNAACVRIKGNGIPPEIYATPVHVLGFVNSTNNTVFDIDAADETIANEWGDAVIRAISIAEEYTAEGVENPDEPPLALEVGAKVGTWTKTAGVSTTTISGLPAQPKAVFMWGSGLSAAAFGTFSSHGSMVFGFTDGTTQRCFGMKSEDNVGTSFAHMWFGDRTFYLIDPSGNADGHIKDKGSVAFTSDGFTITWSLTTLATVGNYMAIWGDDIANVTVKDFLTQTTSTGLVTYNGVGFKPDFGLIISTPGSSPTIPNSDSDPNPNWTAVAGNTTTRNWSTGLRSENNVGTANANRLQRSGKLYCGIKPASDNADALADFVEWQSDGFTWNWTNAPGFTNDPLSGIFIQGGKWDASHYTQPTTGGTSPTGDVTTLLADPLSQIKAIMAFSVGNIEQTSSTSNTHAKMGIGATDGTTQVCTTYADVDAVDVMVNASKMYNNKFMVHTTAAATATSSTEDGISTIQDMATAGEFTVNYSSSDGTARQVVWFSLSA